MTARHGRARIQGSHEKTMKEIQDGRLVVASRIGLVDTGRHQSWILRERYGSSV
jgi:hypothetical protein